MSLGRRIKSRARKLPDNVNRAAIRAGIAINQTVIIATPVDTGQARNNWQASIGRPITSTTLGAADTSGADRISANNIIIKTKPREIALWITNNLPYIGELNRGKSSQAPAGFIKLAIQAATRSLRGVKVFTNG